MLNELSIPLDPDYVQPLGKAQNEFLQVLLTEFNLRPNGQGLTLEVEFDFNTPAVWKQKSKKYIADRLDPALTKKYQEKLESILLGRGETGCRHRDPAFPFRFGNGGTLPVIQRGGKIYYALYYREIDPIGWNIANGGAESFAELMDPMATIERELREELIILDPKADSLYVFDWKEGRRGDHPDFAVARQYWLDQFKKPFRDLGLPLEWLPGADSVVIKFGDLPPRRLDNFLLNINADDFGIELDRVAKINISPDSILLDGEILYSNPLNRMIGLFEVHRLDSEIAGGKTEFSPDLIFWSGRDRSSDTMAKLMNEYLAFVSKIKDRAANVKDYLRKPGPKFGLCPVTRTLIRRHRLYEPAPAPEKHAREIKPINPAETDVFLSFAGEDEYHAGQVFKYLHKTGRNVFFSKETLHYSNFGMAIDQALKAAKSLVVVGTRPEHFIKPWVQYEWQTFHNAILNKIKHGEPPIVTLAVPDISQLPFPLSYRQVIPYNPANPRPALKEMLKFLD